VAQPRDGASPHRGRVLADTARERDGVEASIAAAMAPIPCPQPVHVHVERAAAEVVAGLGRGEHLAHVGAPREAEQPDRCSSASLTASALIPTLLLQPQHRGRVQRTERVAHHQPFERSEAHRGVDADARGDGRDRRTRPRWHVTTRNSVGGRSRRAAARPAHVRVRETVEAEAGHPSRRHSAGIAYVDAAAGSVA